MPRNIERDKREADRRKNQLIEAGFRLFSQNGIETVSLQKVADAANVSPATMYKYFLTKEKLLIAISAKVWDEVWQEALGDPGTNHFEHFTAYQGIEFYADRMIALYKNRPEVLRFSGEYGRHEICRPGAVYPPHDVEGTGAYYKLYHFYYYGLQRPVLLLL